MRRKSFGFWHPTDGKSVSTWVSRSIYLQGGQQIRGWISNTKKKVTLMVVPAKWITISISADSRGISSLETSHHFFCIHPVIGQLSTCHLILCHELTNITSSLRNQFERFMSDKNSIMWWANLFKVKKVGISSTVSCLGKFLPDLIVIFAFRDKPLVL